MSTIPHRLKFQFFQQISSTSCSSYYWSLQINIDLQHYILIWLSKCFSWSTAWACLPWFSQLLQMLSFLEILARTLLTFTKVAVFDGFEWRSSYSLVYNLCYTIQSHDQPFSVLLIVSSVKSALRPHRIPLRFDTIPLPFCKVLFFYFS